MTPPASASTLALAASLFAVAAVSWAPASVVRAEATPTGSLVEVRLRSGRVLSATSAQRVGDIVVVQTAGSTLRIPSKDVVAIVARDVTERRNAGGALSLPEAASDGPSVAGPTARPSDATTARPSDVTTVTNILPGLPEAQLRELLIDRPANGELHLALAQVLNSDGRLTEALQELALIPADASSALRMEKALMRANVLTHLDRPDEALAALSDVPDNARVIKARAAIAADARPKAEAMASTHFRVHFPDGSDQFDAAPLLAELERAHALIESALGPGPREPIIVLLYPGDTFWETTGQGGNVNGLFDGKVRVPTGRVSPPSPRLSEVLRHEVAHAFIHVIAAGRASAWWHEGLAEHFEGDDIGPTLRSLAAKARESGRESGSWPPAITHEVAHARMEWFLRRYGMATAAEILRRTAGSGEASATRAATGLSSVEFAEAWRLALVEGGN